MSVISCRDVTRKYGKFTALDRVNLDVRPGRIVGLVGPNGAGKTTLLKGILGLGRCEGALSVLGLDPHGDRNELMQRVCYIADVAVMPGWMKVCDAVDFVSGVHPRFDRDKAMGYLAKTEILPKSKIKTLSKGMKTQLHLALVMAIEADLLVLDEPTLGLDILYRKAFYTDLLNEYFDEQRTILITTHQVEEVEHILTDLVFIRKGRIVLDAEMDQIGKVYTELMTKSESLEEARALGPIHEQEVFGRTVMLFRDVPRERLAPLGEVRTPGVADLFVALMKGESA